MDPVKEITSLSTLAIIRLLKIVLYQCYFSWDSVLYRQKSSLPMGSQLSPIIANLYMEDLEHKVPCTAIIIPKTYFRYVDDVFLVWNNRRGSHKEFLDLLNAQHPHIVLTEECEVERTLPFLDISLTRLLISDTGEVLEPMQIAIYHKPTHCDRYLHFKSSHPSMLRQNVLKGLFLRGQRLLKNYPRQLKNEMNHLKNAFSHASNGYPRDMIDRCFKKFEKELRRFPEKLEVRSRLRLEDLFTEEGQQRFSWPTALGRFSTEDQEELISCLEEEREAKLGEPQHTEDQEEIILDLEEDREVELGELQHMQIMDGDCQRTVPPEEALQVTGDAGNGPVNEKVKGILA
ncbi:MAG: hypothetical protein GY861_04965, partial [bacterium]|nr:hypothetical protein [bacterium]